MMIRFICISGAFLLASPPCFAQISGAIRSDVQYGAPLKLQAYGGPNVDLVIRNKNMDTVDFTIVDIEHQVAVAVGGGDYNPGAQPQVVFQPTKTSRSVKLEEGIEVTDLHRQAYLLYEHPGGFKVYYLDALDTNIGGCALLVLPSNTPKPKEAGPADERLRQVEKLEKEGLISTEEARKKRAEILGSL
jgi:hypothetical protein